MGALAEAAAGVLAKKGVPGARLDADLLLAHVLGVERIEVYTRHDMPVDDAVRGEYRALIERRIAREPVAYLIGRRDFLDHTFAVGPGVLVPRPETEEVVEAALGALGELAAPRVLDLGVGSGCMLLSVLARLEGATGVGVDASEEALAWARRNAASLGLAERADLRRGDLFAALEAGETFDLLISNPPYVKEGDRPVIMPDVRDHEPSMALFVAGDGLGFYRRILAGCGPHVTPGALVVLELPGEAADEIARLARASLPGADVEIRRDLTGCERIFVARNRHPA